MDYLKILEVILLALVLLCNIGLWMLNKWCDEDEEYKREIKENRENKDIWGEN